MRSLKLLIWAIVVSLLGTTAVSTADPRHPANPPAVVSAADPSLAPLLERLSNEVEEERSAVATTSALLTESSAKVTLLLIACIAIVALLICVLVGQVVILYRSLAIVRADAVARNRPRLVLRHTDLEIFSVGRLAKVLWMVENIGNASATIVEAHATLKVVRRGNLAAIPEYDARNHTAGGIEVEAGRVVPFVQFSHEELASNEYDAVFRSGTATVFFYGYMLYVDEVAARRRVGFCRQYDQASGRFVVVDDLNYEYAD